MVACCWASAAPGSSAARPALARSLRTANDISPPALTETTEVNPAPLGRHGPVEDSEHPLLFHARRTVGGVGQARRRPTGRALRLHVLGDVIARIRARRKRESAPQSPSRGA